MGVDSGLPDFRGDVGFWKAYPPFQKLGLSFRDLANPTWFRRDPHLAWGFYGHRLNLYRATEPHAGFALIREFCAGKQHFAFTSNVDGQFQKAGFEEELIQECHGSIHHLQCTSSPCNRVIQAVWPADDTVVDVDETTFRARDPLPVCPFCGSLARPNILMFGDDSWLSDRAAAQQKRRVNWERTISGPVVAIECGAGTAIPTVRYQCEAFVRRHGGTLIRINPREADGPRGTISIELGALPGLRAIAETPV